MNPAISIIIPTHNRADLLPETLASVQSQTFDDWEVLVIDDSSTDQTHEVLKRLARNDSRIRWYPQDFGKQGAPAARNTGLARSESEYVLFLDSDDLLAPTCLQGRMTAFEDKPESAAVVGLASLFVDHPDTQSPSWRVWTKENDLQRFLRFDEPWQTSGPLWKRDVFERMGGWNEDLAYYQDWELAARALSGGIMHTRIAVNDYYIRRDERPRISGNRQTAKDTCHLTDATASLRTLEKGSVVSYWLPSICLNLARRHAFLGSIPSAMTVWRHCLKNRYVSKITYAAALPLLMATRAQIAVKPMQSFANNLAKECFPSAL